MCHENFVIFKNWAVTLAKWVRRHLPLKLLIHKVGYFYNVPSANRQWMESSNLSSVSHAGAYWVLQPWRSYVRRRTPLLQTQLKKKRKRSLYQNWVSKKSSVLRAPNNRVPSSHLIKQVRNKKVSWRDSMRQDRQRRTTKHQFRWSRSESTNRWLPQQR